jgi:hypothetical protein
MEMLVALCPSKVCHVPPPMYVIYVLTTYLHETTQIKHVSQNLVINHSTRSLYRLIFVLKCLHNITIGHDFDKLVH